MKTKNKHAGTHAGFTVIELIAVVIFLAVAATFLAIQRGELVAAQTDIQRKIAVNAFYYSLEKVYYPAHNSYPETLSSSALTAVDPTLLTDTNNKKPGDTGYEYRYSPTGCVNGACKNYTLSVDLQKEADYTKTSGR